MSDDETLVPRLRFPEFRNAGPWGEKRLGEICDMNAGDFVRAANIKNDSNEDLFPCYGGNGLRGFTETSTHDGTFSLIGRQGALCGNITLVSGKFHATEHAVVTTPKENTVTGWLYYQLIRLNLNQHATGQAQPGLSVTNLNEISVTIPEDGAEQQKIADCLVSLDDLISARGQKLAALERHKKGLMQQLFPATGQTTPALRFPEFRNAGPWKEKRLGDVCDMNAGDFVRAANINDVAKEDLFPCYGGNGLRGFTETFTHDGTFSLIGRQGALCGNITLVSGKFHATEHAVVTTPKENTVTGWLYYQLIRLNLNQYATGQAQPGLSVTNLNEISVTIPEDEHEQQKIADCLASLDDLIDARGQKLAALERHKKGLMQQLFPVSDAVGG